MFNRENRHFLVVNAFTESPFAGNPAAVFPRAEGLSESEMQMIARQLNLVETVFVFPSGEPGVDRCLRYFTPTKEVAIAGHPTVAAWLALIHDGTVRLSEQRIYTQRTQPGIQRIDITSLAGREVIFMEQLPPKFLMSISDRALVAEVFGIDTHDLVESLPIQAIDTGLGHLIVPLRGLEALMRVQRNTQRLQELCTSVGVREAQLFCFETRNSELNAHTRNLCPREGIEDPACGVGNGALGAYLARYCHPNRKELHLRMEQGHIVGMPSIIEVKVATEASKLRISIGGTGVVMLSGDFVVGH